MSSSDEAEAKHETAREAELEPEAEPGQSVGYGKPPIPTRFKKGVSGNPKGRPKGSLNVATVFTKTLLEKVVINEHGQRRTVTKLEAALKQLTNKAASGDLRAVRQLVELARDAEAKQKASAVQRPTTDEFDQEVIDGIVKRVNREEEESQTLQEADYVEDQRS
jgi:hypothetical protein